MRGWWAVAGVVLFSSACSSNGGSGGGPPPTGPAAIRVSPPALDFGSPRLGATVARTLTVSNVGGEPLAVSAVELEGGTSAEFAVVPPPSAALQAIAPGASVDVEVRYTPSAIAARSGGVVVWSNDAARPGVVVAVSSSITGASEIAVLASPDPSPLAADVRAHDFGPVGVDAAREETLYVLNVGTGNAPLTIGAVAVEPADARFADLVAALPASLQPARVCNLDQATCSPGETCSRANEPAPAVGHCRDAGGKPSDALALTVRFAPGSGLGAFGATLRIANDELDSGGDLAEAPAYTIALAGTGVAATCTPSGAEACNGADDDCDGLNDEPAEADAACAAIQPGASCANGGTARASCAIAQASCAAGFYDIDGEVANGCEYRCTLAAGADLPDDSFADTNCDGVDGDVTRAIFVAQPPFGDDAAAGTRSAPVATLARAGQLAAAQNRDLYVAAGSFQSAGTLAVPQGSSVYGGFAAAGPLGPFTGGRNGIATLAGASTALRVASSTGVVLDRLAIGSADAAAASAASIALDVVSSTVTLNRVDLLAGRGGPGAAGVGLPGSASAGAPGAAAGARTGGLGGSFAAAGGRGGDGGIGFSSGSTGGQGSGGAVGGSGGAPSCTGIAGTNGSDGTAGSAGSGGAGLASVVGVFTDGAWSAASASAGAAGGIGEGAAGGGGSGGTGTTANGCTSSTPANGGGGGGGGGGGSGGAGGGGGRQGGASFAVLARGSTVTLRDSTVRVSGGGGGGLGGLGQLGGAGGATGAGAVGAGGASGGRGGRGGDGGRGGNGGCGAGGPSVGLVAVPDPAAPASFTRQGSVTFVLPAPAPGATGTCDPGAAGLVHEEYPAP